MRKAKVLTTDLGVLKNFPQLLVDAVKGATEEEILSKLKGVAGTRFDKFIKTKKEVKIGNFRTLLDTFAPAIYFVDYVQLKKELQILKTKAQQLRTAEPKGSFEQQISSLSYREDERLDEVINAIIEGVVIAVKQFKASSSPRKVSYKALAKLYSLGGQFGLKIAQNLYPFEIKEKVGSNVSEAFVFKNYDEVGEKLGRRINKSVTETLKEQGITKLKDVLILGHAAAGTTPSEDDQTFYASTPKLTQILLEQILDSALASPNFLPSVEVDSLEDLAVDYLTKTEQLKVESVVEVSKDFSTGFLQIFVKAGGQIYRPEAAISNNIKSALEGAETGGRNQELLSKLKQFYEALNSDVNDIANNAVRKVLIESLPELTKNTIKSKSSPSLVSYLEDIVSSILQGKSVKPYSNTSSNTTKSKLPSIGTKQKSVLKLKTTRKKLKIKATPITATRVIKSTVSLSKLLSTINGLLEQQIRKNMGTGDSKRILNYRSGRFAEGVKVEKLSESRQGMITAFYSYMKNPYATFSEGGRQALPASRDPKLLISKSIREIAQTMVTNRLRAVNV